MTDRLKLVFPAKEYEAQVWAMREAFFENGDGFDGCCGLGNVHSYDEWLDFEGRLKKLGWCQSTVRLAMRISDGKIVGIIDLRHELNDFLLKYGGNIGYSVLPSERGNGYAREMLSLMLKEARAIGLGRVLVCCDKENPASAKTIIRCGGILENEVADEAGLCKDGDIIQRYWIEL